MNREFTTPAPSCPLPITHPARAYVPAHHTDVSRTWREHSTLELLDDYELTDALGYLEQMGAYK